VKLHTVVAMVKTDTAAMLDRIRHTRATEPRTPWPILAMHRRVKAARPGTARQHVQASATGASYRKRGEVVKLQWTHAQLEQIAELLRMRRWPLTER
jgi:hypothetical protein